LDLYQFTSSSVDLFAAATSVVVAPAHKVFPTHRPSDRRGFQRLEGFQNRTELEYISIQYYYYIPGFWELSGVRAVRNYR